MIHLKSVSVEYQNGVRALNDANLSICKGDFAFIKNWLHDNVHQYGRQYSSQELLKKITGRDITTKPYVNYLKKKYSELYKL